MPRAGQPLSLKGWFLRLAIAGLLAAILIASAAGWASWHEQKSRLSESLLATSRATVTSVERELDQAVALAWGLSISQRLRQSDLESFAAQVRPALLHYGYGLAVHALRPERRLLAIEMPSGEPLPDGIDQMAADTLSGHVTVMPIQQTVNRSLWVTVVQVPILTDANGPSYVLSIAVPTVNFQRIIDGLHLPQSWRPVILDNDWRVVARRPDPERFIGHKGAAQEMQHLPVSDIVYEITVLEGVRALSARSRSERYGWTAAVGPLVSAMSDQFLGQALIAAGGGFVVAGLAIGAILLFSAYLGSSIQSLADGTAALAEGKPVHLGKLPVRELHLVGEGMKAASTKLLGYQHELETRVAEAIKNLQREEEERRKAEAALAHARRLDSIGQLTGGIAHDLNNMLMVISASLELIERQATTDRLKQLVARARSGTAKGARLVSALLAFARKQPLRTEIVNINDLIQEFEPVLKGAVGDTIMLKLILNPLQHLCRIDGAQFQSALLNLLTNSHAAMPDGGNISIETSTHEAVAENVGKPALEPGLYVRISVTDTGPGMPPDAVARAFEPFYTTKEPGKGTGLGLSQVYGFTKQSGGNILLASQPGAGVAMHLYLPVCVQPDLETDAPSPNTLVEGAGQRVLIVDDDPDVRAALSDGLSSLGFQVANANDGLDALKLIESGQQVDVVVTDDLMPNQMTGRELVHRISTRNPRIVVILLTGNPSVEQTNEGVPVLLKPVLLADLARTIRAALAGSEAK